MATHASAETIAYVGRMAQIDQDDFAAVCWWEFWSLTWSAIGDQAANDLSFQRAQLVVETLEDERDERDAARARLAKPTQADIARVLAESVRYHARNCTAGRSLMSDKRGQDLLESIVRNIIGNTTYAIADLFAVEE